MKLDFFTGKNEKYIEDYLRNQMITVIQESFWQTKEKFEKEYPSYDCFKYQFEWKIKKCKKKKSQQKI